MSNSYCSITQLNQLVDLRTTGELSDDTDQGVANATNQQMALDVAASELAGLLQGRYTITATVPLVLTRWVAVKGAEILFGRRTKMPEQVSKAVEWADNWAKDLMAGKVSVPGYGRANTMAVQQASSGEPDRSRFDGIAYFDQSVPGGTGTPED